MVKPNKGGKTPSSAERDAGQAQRERLEKERKIANPEEGEEKEPDTDAERSDER